MRNPVWISRNINVAAPAQVKDVIAFLSQAFHDINASVHQADHGVPGAGPKIPVTFGRFITRQREGCPFIDEKDVLHPVPNGQMIRRRNAGNSRTADDDISGVSLSMFGHVISFLNFIDIREFNKSR
jgi:hypothetical protein